MYTAMMITFIFLVLLLLSVLTFTILTAIRKGEFEEALVSPLKDEGPKEEQPR
ncbi:MULTISPECIES: hypothetical protein [Brevibacillus]|jgi:cbb3-type cytochrome oxidase subunit 3|uniref:Uncharacterized protein n=1 Tax=Brevibacillus parabrevis TaxID=54914 RepID=A0A4Y3PWN6_BREPA|nr:MULTISPECIES: hypothetical protein [Brevibacillus]MBU8715536.1 hypothetical protein [Brevibacillus parabrevis]MDH6352169.1 cbb3-type cytochrome oxidase subunit 3 [Brevibacillus sp. 1238]MDR4998963.1 hypothetical protein [Brevibacillus parabrevis]MED1722340.1 hypothetical protein [Brevibacillus parabrevis]MED2254472.1 hypothetical protein [Brevibacillus parabrevis]